MAKILHRTLAVCFSIAMPATISEANTILATLCWRLALEAALPNSVTQRRPVDSPGEFTGSIAASLRFHYFA
jgi:hypothetical protein